MQFLGFSDETNLFFLEGALQRSEVFLKCGATRKERWYCWLNLGACNLSVVEILSLNTLGKSLGFLSWCLGWCGKYIASLWFISWSKRVIFYNGEFPISTFLVRRSERLRCCLVLTSNNCCHNNMFSSRMSGISIWCNYVRASCLCLSDKKWLCLHFCQKYIVLASCLVLGKHAISLFILYHKSR